MNTNKNQVLFLTRAQRIFYYSIVWGTVYNRGMRHRGMFKAFEQIISALTLTKYCNNIYQVQFTNTLTHSVFKALCPMVFDLIVLYCI